MFLIVGLGNPGLQYAYNRHNVGFLAIDYISFDLGFPASSKKFDGVVTEKVINGEKYVLLKPETYMNLSGRSVSQIISFYKIPTENVFVIHDDIDLKPFEIKVKLGGGNGGHNGIRSIDSSIGKEYWRIRIGVGRPVLKEEVANYVLSNFYKDEITKDLSDVFHLISSNLLDIIASENKPQLISSIIKK